MDTVSRGEEMGESPNSILVADSESRYREVLCDALRDAGYAVAEAGDGLEATGRIEADPPDLVLLDIDMPKLDGWGVLEHIRTTQAPSHVLVMTDLEQLVPPDYGLIQCVSGYLIKPFPVEHVLDTCKLVLAGTHVVPATGTRKEERRLFVAEAVLLSDDGARSTRGTLVQVSRHGFRLAINATVQPGDLATLTVRVPGRKEPLQVTGRVRWRDESALGAEIESISTTEEQFLQALMRFCG
jgi:DNA-binding response OmpR family regulator